MHGYTVLHQNVHAAPWLWLIPLFPLLGATINGLFGKRLQDRFGKRAVHSVAVGAMVAAALVAIVHFALLWSLAPGERYLGDLVFPMVDIGAARFNMAFAMDPLSGMMALIITIIGTLIHIYSTGYMHSEPAYWRFFCYLNLFVFSMLLLVLGDNFLIMFFGWEGVGLCSYLLIGFWYTDVAKARAGMKAFVVNRVGDFGFVTGVFFLFWGLGGSWSGTPGHEYTRDLGVGRVVQARAAVETGEPGAKAAHEEEGGNVTITVGPSFTFREIHDQLALTDPDGRRPLADRLAGKTVWGLPLVFLICLGMFIGATGKSAQIPLYVWLPDAMAGPTPVSALIHAATMVTAGVYMVARLNFLFALSPGAMTVVAGVGVLTALFAATMGFFQYDIKKVLAYSTVSQLGFMFIGVGTGAYWAGAFHLLTHACFKACLFLGSGSVIHGMHFLEHKKHHHGHDPQGAHGHGHEEEPHGVAAHEHATPDVRLAPDPYDPQDMRNMGGLRRLMPSTHLTYLLACITISGLVGFSAFFSKDEILFKAFTNANTLIPGPVIWFFGTLAALGTSFYMFRSYYMTFWFREPTQEMKEHVHESPRSMTWVLWILAAGSVVIGVVLGFPHAQLLERWLEPVTASARVAFRDVGAIEYVLMAFGGLVVPLTGWGIARHFYKDAARAEARKQVAAVSGWHRVLFNKYYVDEIYAATVVRGTMALSRALAWFDGHVVDFIVNFVGKLAVACAWVGGQIDKWIVDGAVNGVAEGIIASGRQLRRVQTGRINNYAAVVAIGAVALIVIAFLGQG
jgi:NADH-quinone oxidoreductase subunit L